MGCVQSSSSWESSNPVRSMMKIGSSGCVFNRVMRGVVVVCLSLFARGAGAQPQTITVPANLDNTLYEDFEGAYSNGHGSYIFVGTTTSRAIRRAVISFDLSIIPPTSTVTSATLRLYMSRTRSGGQP